MGWGRLLKRAGLLGGHSRETVSIRQVLCVGTEGSTVAFWDFWRPVTSL
jgi:hypothetical protein